MAARGKFITFEGLDGAGKSTHIPFLAELIRQRGETVVVTREPGGTPLGEELRRILLATPMHLETETLLMFAARREHVANLIEPALARGNWVLCDRFTDATFAYQGGGRALGVEKVATLAYWVHARTNPDLTLLFDVPLETAQARIAANREGKDRFEAEAVAFHARVREAYLARAHAEPTRMRIIDGSQTIANIEKLLQQMIATI